jgi:hypothetical protein
VPWYEDTLLDGTRWFAVTAPGPGGHLTRVCRFRAKSVRRERLAGGNWGISAQLEQRGRSAPPVDPCDVALLLLMGGADGSTTFTDLSPASNAVTAFGSAQVDVVGADNYLLLPGDLSYLSVAHAAAVNLVGTDFTLEAIVNVTAYTTNPSASWPLFFKDGVDSAHFPSYGLDIAIDGRLLGIVGPGSGLAGGSTQGLFGTSAVGLGADRHVAFTRKDSTLRVFNGGIKEGEALQTVTMGDGGRPLLIGWEQGKGADWYSNMRVKAVRIWRCCRYENDFTPPTTFTA